MAASQEIPQLVTELFDMSKEYLRQETIEPAKRLGRQAGMGISGAMVMATGCFLLVLGLYFALEMLLPEGEWWVVLARALTAVGALAAAGLIAWQMQRSAESAG